MPALMYRIIFFMKQEDILPGEEFRPVVGFEGYLVSNFGRIYSQRRKHTNGGFRVSQTNLKGYKHVGFTKNGRAVTVTIHRMVAMAFLNNPDNLPSINHKDGDKSNNFASNIEWCTHLENLTHAFDNGLRVPVKNEEHWNSKLKCSDIHVIRNRLSCGDMIKSVAQDFGVSAACISAIKNGRSWVNI